MKFSIWAIHMTMQGAHWERDSMDDDNRKRMRSSKSESQSENPTLKRLAGTPFKTASEMNEAEAKIFKETWEELTRAKSFESLTEKEHFAFFKKIFERGMRCRYGEGTEDLVRINLRNGEIVVEINEEMKSRDHSEKFVSSLTQGLSDSFFTNYLKAMRILPPEEAPKSSEKKSSKKS